MLKTVILSRTLSERTFQLAGLLVVFCSVAGGHQKEMDALHASALVECTIEARPAGSDVVVKVTIANHSRSPYRLLEWNLPKSGEMTSALFRIARDGSAVEYRGRVVKRVVTPRDYFSVPAGKSFSAYVGLLQAYDVQRAGEYKITYELLTQRNDLSGMETLTSNTVTLVKN
jgi:hypothetical protein